MMAMRARTVEIVRMIWITSVARWYEVEVGHMLPAMISVIMVTRRMTGGSW